MPLRICVYEDDTFARFFPLTILRPVYLLRAGIMPLYQRAMIHFPGSSLSLITRDDLSVYTAEQARDYPVNIIKREANMDVLFLNGRIRSYGDLPKLVRESRLSTVFKSGDEVAAVLFKIETLGNVPPMATQHEYLAAYSEGGELPDFPTTATLYHGWWSLVDDIERAITEEVQFLKEGYKQPETAIVREGAAIVNRQNVYLGENVDILPGSVLDATKGPIYIGSNTRIEPHAAVFGPCYIGANSVVVAGKIVASSIGPTSRVGGEVEETVFQSHVNKFHAGFIGHSYTGSWVNFGAMTTNSDLKNNYSTVRVQQSGESIDTGLLKVGSCIGDHTKFGIGSLLTTGITIGVCCNIFGGGLTSDKEVPSFQWGNSSAWETYDFDKAVQTARRAAERRNVKISDREIELLRLACSSELATSGGIRF